VIDSRSVKTTESGGPRGHDVGKKIKSRKRHAMVDINGRGLTLDTHPANVHDRDGAPPLMRASRGRWPFVQLAFMDSGYAGDGVADATTIRVEIVRKPKDQVGFAVHARRWVVERFFAWIRRRGPSNTVFFEVSGFNRHCIPNPCIQIGPVLTTSGPPKASQPDKRAAPAARPTGINPAPQARVLTTDTPHARDEERFAEVSRRRRSRIGAEHLAAGQRSFITPRDDESFCPPPP
jgi:transposase